MTIRRLPGQDGRMDFDDLSDEALHARSAELRAKAAANVAQAKAAGARTAVGVKARDDAQNALTLAKAMDAELKGRAERAAHVTDPSQLRAIDPDTGAMGAPGSFTGGLGAKAQTHLTRDALRTAAATAVNTGFVAGGQKALSLTDHTAVAVVAPGLAPLGRPRGVLDVIEAQATTAPAFRFLKQTSRANNAAVVAAGAVKPTSTYGLAPVDRTLQVVAHVSDAIAEYDLSDVANLTTFVQAEMEYGLALAIERQVFQGTGAAGQLHGLAGESGVQVQAFASDLLTTTRKSLTAIESLGYMGAVFVVSPGALEEIDLATTSGSGEYQNVRAPFDRAEYKLWGVPVVVSTELPADTAYLIGANSVIVWSDPGAAVRVQWDRVNDDFQRNQVRCRLEGRFEVAVSRPEAIVRIDTAE
ncbi:phage major capsid protein [Gordonia sp. NPDC003424]